MFVIWYFRYALLTCDDDDDHADVGKNVDVCCSSRPRTLPYQSDFGHGVLSL